MRVIRLMKEVAGEGRIGRLLSLFTPHHAQERGPFVRVILAGASVALMGAALGAALHAATVLLVAMMVFYYLLTQVLGVKLDIDPRLLVQQAQRYVGPPSAPN